MMYYATTPHTIVVVSIMVMMRMLAVNHASMYHALTVITSIRNPLTQTNGYATKDMDARRMVMLDELGDLH
tara:strand:+ start:396 stop:608 length:213 start_codon:yes stop_codon:yes gene_type:complete